jgi:hypothetical protein
MKRFPSAFYLIAAICILAGCITEERSGGNPPYTTDPTQTFENGERRPRIPQVSYRTRDTLVYINITGPAREEENRFWIQRNGKLLEQPFYVGSGYPGYLYRLIDTVRAPGVYAYSVQYGERAGYLSGKSPEYVYDYAGSSRSGLVSLNSDDDQLVRIILSHSPDESIGQAYFERRIGPGGGTEILDTVLHAGSLDIGMVDTNFIPLDTTVYYRAVAMDGLTETWLEPTPWDSIVIRNAAWHHIPRVSVDNLGTRVEVSIYNALRYSRKAFYYLYRNSAFSREGGAKVDSLAMDGSPGQASLSDRMDSGSYWYWVEGRDPFGRTSARSVPIQVRFTGIPKGPDIRSISDQSSVVNINPDQDPMAIGYILQRVSDTDGTIGYADTQYVAQGGSSPYFTDIPPAEGRWFYRAISLYDGTMSSPGDWKQSEFISINTYFSTLEASIVNRGEAGVEATISPNANASFALYRSRRADGSDSVLADSISVGDSRVRMLDKPGLGTWFYRVRRFDKPSGQSHYIFRSELVRIEYTGKPVGPAITFISDLPGGLKVILANDPEALAYVLERSEDTSGDWSVTDTISANTGIQESFFDRPPKNGYWSYRARTMTRDLKLTEPGALRRTSRYWTYRVEYANDLVAVIANAGPMVECRLTTSDSYGFYLKRSAVSDYGSPTTVDSAGPGAPGAKLTDIPAKGTWYYWVERMLPETNSNGSIRRSAILRVEFTGAPEVVSLVQYHNGSILVNYPGMAKGDTLEIWKSGGNRDDSASYSILAGYVTSANPSYYEDLAVDKSRAAFHHYRLAIRRVGGRTAMGPAKSLYYQVE